LLEKAKVLATIKTFSDQILLPDRVAVAACQSIHLIAGLVIIENPGFSLIKFSWLLSLKFELWICYRCFGSILGATMYFPSQ